MFNASAINDTNLLHFSLEKHVNNIDILHQLPTTSQDILLLHFFGSSPDHSLGMINPEPLNQHYRRAGACPIFLSFRLNLLETTKSTLNTIYQDTQFRYLLMQLLRFGMAKLCQSKTDYGKLLILPLTSEILSTLDTADSEVLHLRREPYSYLNSTRLPPGETLRQIERDQLHTALLRNRKTDITSRIIAKAERVLRLVFERIADYRDHGLYTTVVEEILREFYPESPSITTWENFKEALKSSLDPERNTTGGIILRWLADKIRAKEPLQRIILVGHGIGADCLCYCMQHLKNMNVSKQITFGLILIAPACSFQLFKNSALHHDHQIEKILLLGLQDSFERVDVFSGAIYPRSLLYFISGLLEKEVDQPLLGMQRFYRELPFNDADLFPDINQVRQFIEKHRGHLIWSRTVEREGLASQAKCHVDFLQDNQTIESIFNFIRHKL